MDSKLALLSFVDGSSKVLPEKEVGNYLTDLRENHECGLGLVSLSYLSLPKEQSK